MLEKDGAAAQETSSTNIESFPYMVPFEVEGIGSKKVKIMKESNPGCSRSGKNDDGDIEDVDINDDTSLFSGGQLESVLGLASEYKLGYL